MAKDWNSGQQRKQGRGKMKQNKKKKLIESAAIFLIMAAMVSICSCGAGGQPPESMYSQNQEKKDDNSQSSSGNARREAGQHKVKKKPEAGYSVYQDDVLIGHYMIQDVSQIGDAESPCIRYKGSNILIKVNNGFMTIETGSGHQTRYNTYTGNIRIIADSTPDTQMSSEQYKAE